MNQLPPTTGGLKGYHGSTYFNFSLTISKAFTNFRSSQNRISLRISIEATIQQPATLKKSGLSWRGLQHLQQLSMSCPDECAHRSNSWPYRPAKQVTKGYRLCHLCGWISLWSCKTENAICRDMSWSCILPYSLVWSCLLPLLSLVHLWSSWKLLNAKSGLFRQDSWVSYKTRPSGNETYRIQRTWIGLKSPELRFCPIKWMHRIHSTQPRSSWMVLEWRLKSLLNQRTPLRYGGALVQGLENHQCNQGRCSASTQEEHYFQIQAPPVQYTSSAAWRNNLTLELKYIFTYTDTYMWGLK